MHITRFIRDLFNIKRGRGGRGGARGCMSVIRASSGCKVTEAPGGCALDCHIPDQGLSTRKPQEELRHTRFAVSLCFEISSAIKTGWGGAVGCGDSTMAETPSGMGVLH